MHSLPNHMARDGEHVVLHPAIWAEGVDFMEAHGGFFEKRKGGRHFSV